VTPLRVSIAAAVGSVLLILVVLELIRRRRLHERYAILWLVTGLVILALSLWRSGLDTIAGALGVSYAPAILFALLALFFILVLLHYSIVISKLTDENTILAQRLALLELRMNAVEGEREELDDDLGNAPDRGPSSRASR
jgi:hypothetical protein